MSPAAALLRTLRDQAVVAFSRLSETVEGDEPDPGTGHNGWGCFVPDLTRLAALPCGEARQG